MKTGLLIIIMIHVPGLILLAQGEPEKTLFREKESVYYNSVIMKDVKSVSREMKRGDKEYWFLLDQSEMTLPNNPAQYKSYWSNPGISQGNAGTCWSYSTTSFFESEIKRIHGKEIKLSEIYTVYWEYVEKARRFVQERGNSLFAEGSQANAVKRMWKRYGVVPLEVYSGLKHGREFHSHEEMFMEMESYLKHIQKRNEWNEELVISTIKSIMNYHIGAPPESFSWQGKEFTPLSFLQEYLKINPDDYIDILSIKQQPYWKQVEYEVPDNWWHSKEYYNVPLDVFMDIIEDAVKDGYTMFIGGDVSESGYSRETNCAVVPDFDIPSEYIDENARQLRFCNGATTDDHGMHLIGYYKDKAGKNWYMLKDSGSGSRDVGEESPAFGYRFYREDYVKLKMMNFMVHKDAVAEVLKKF